MHKKMEQMLARRRSLRSFSDRPVARETLEHLFESARWASSAYNEQPWSYAVLDDPKSELWQKVVGSMLPHNKAWAEKAPVVLASIAQMKFKKNDGVNRHAFHDVGQANAYLALQAAELGLTVHLIGGFDHLAAKNALGLPDGYEVVALMPIAYPGPPEKLPDPLREREVGPRERKPISMFAHFGMWREDSGK